MIKGLLHHLPDVVRPPDTVCYTIEVPNDPWYLRAFVGTFFELASARSWDNDEAHTALDVAKVWLEIALALRPGCDNNAGAGDSGGDMARLRQDPDNPCILQQECLPDQWVTLFDASLCLQASPGQPGPGGPGPGSGETQQFCLKLNGNGQVLLPIAVQGNWTIELVQKQGGWTDGSGAWYCPNGQSYTLGLCTGVGGFNGGDPLPTALHACIVGQINSLWYDGNGLITVPAGLTDQQVVFQMNDASLSDNHGDISFCVKVTAPIALPIGITYAFGTGPSSVASGGIISVVSETDAGVFQRFDVSLTECCKVEVLASSSWGPTGIDSNSPAYFDCASVVHNHSGIDVAPEVYLANVNSGDVIANGANGSVFTTQMRITRL